MSDTTNTTTDETTSGSASSSNTTSNVPSGTTTPIDETTVSLSNTARAFRIRKADGSLGDLIQVGVNATNVACTYGDERKDLQSVLNTIKDYDVSSLTTTVSTLNGIVGKPASSTESASGLCLEVKNLNEIVGNPSTAAEGTLCNKVNTLNTQYTALNKTVNGDKSVTPNVDGLTDKLTALDTKVTNISNGTISMSYTEVWSGDGTNAFAGNTGTNSIVSETLIDSVMEYIIVYKNKKNVGEDHEIHVSMARANDGTTTTKTIYSNISKPIFTTTTGEGTAAVGTYRFYDRLFTFTITEGKKCKITAGDCKACGLLNPFTLSEDNTELDIVDPKLNWSIDNDYLIPIKILAVKYEIKMDTPTNADTDATATS